MRKILRGLLIIAIFGVCLGLISNTVSKQDSNNLSNRQQTISRTPEQLSKDYCNNRRDSTRLYPILNLVEDENGKAELKSEIVKIGTRLTLEDCTEIITALMFVNEKERMENIVDQKMWVGMSKFELGSSAGQPDRMISNSGNRGTWIYQSPNGQTMMFYFNGNTLNEWVGDE